MMRRVICGVVALGVLVGCAPIQPPQPGTDHPASPDAAQAEDAELSDVLAVDEENLPQMPPEMRRDRIHQGHGRKDGRMSGPAAQDAAPSAGYTCPMHPEVSMEAPGKCPRCGLDLMPKGGPPDE